MARKGLQSQPDPVRDYAEALARLAQWQSQETEPIVDACRLQWMTHDEKTEQAIVLFHGFTSCPGQFLELGQHFYQQGYNVLLPRVPFHGLIDHMSKEPAKMTAEMLVSVGDRAIDIAQGLGQRVQVAGLSMGGVMASWVAQHRADVEQTTIIAPALGLKALSPFWTPAFSFVTRFLPSLFGWFDPATKADVPRAPYIYPQFSYRAIGQFLRLGLYVRKQARRQPPAASSIVMVTNDNDFLVDNEVALQLAQDWAAHGRAEVRTFTFERRLGLFHDLIDIRQPGEQTHIVYPKLIELITNAALES